MQKQNHHLILLLFASLLIAHSCASPKRHLIKDQPMENTFVLANIVNLKESLNQRSPVFQVCRGLTLNRFPDLSKGGKDFFIKRIGRDSKNTFFLLSDNDLKLNGQRLGEYSILKQNEQGLFGEKIVQSKFYTSSDTVEEALFYNNTFQVSMVMFPYHDQLDSINTGLWYNFYYQDRLVAQYNRLKIEISNYDRFYFRDNKTYGFINDSELVVFDGKQVLLLGTADIFQNRPFIYRANEFIISGDWAVFAITQNIGRTVEVIDNETQIEYALLCINYKTGESFLPDYELVD